ncbi:ABC transporter substrate-binding protein [Halomonas sp.]|uniref:ABC transporter substrate-binding protein n=1 Tax=Halomonas sp. TaxID=1486246 RepID=UPI00262DDA54|nr:ABC transporter substrate-binding protein [Halomonas sp.]
MPHPAADACGRRPLLATLLIALLLSSFSPAWAETEAALEAPPPLTLDGEVMVPDLGLSPGDATAPATDAMQASAAEATLPAPPVSDAGEAMPDAPAVEVPSVVHAPPEPLEPPPLDTLTIMLDWYPSLHQAALLLAAGNGLPRREGLSLEIERPADPAAPLRLLGAGLVDLALTHQPQLHLQVARGKPLVRVATLVDTPLAGLVMRESRAGQGPESLAGRRLGVATEAARDLLLPALLLPHGIGVDEVALAETGFTLATALSEQDLDGVITPVRLALPRQLADRGVATRLFRLEEHGVPVHDGLILVANRDRLARLRGPLDELVGILRDTTLWMIEEPQAAWDKLVALEPTLDTPANRDAWPAVLMRLSAQPAALDAGRYRRMEALLQEQGMVEAPRPLEQLAVDLGAE